MIRLLLFIGMIISFILVINFNGSNDKESAYKDYDSWVKAKIEESLYWRTVLDHNGK